MEARGEVQDRLLRQSLFRKNDRAFSEMTVYVNSNADYLRKAADTDFECNILTETAGKDTEIQYNTALYFSNAPS